MNPANGDHTPAAPTHAQISVRAAIDGHPLILIAYALLRLKEARAALAAAEDGLADLARLGGFPLEEGLDHLAAEEARDGEASQ